MDLDLNRNIIGETYENPRKKDPRYKFIDEKLEEISEEFYKLKEADLNKAESLYNEIGVYVNNNYEEPEKNEILFHVQCEYNSSVRNRATMIYHKGMTDIINFLYPKK